MIPCRCFATGHEPGCPNYLPSVQWFDREGKPLANPPGVEIRIVSQSAGSDRDMIRWLAQTVHQAYHQDQPGIWETCPRDVCASVKKHLDGLL